MGGVAVLQPHVLIRERMSGNNLTYSPFMKSRRNPNPNSSRSNRQKRSTTRLQQKNNSNKAMVENQSPKNNLVMGQVRILKRGETLKDMLAMEIVSEVNQKMVSFKDLNDSVLSSTDRLGPEPDMVSKHMGIANSYAGSAIVTSPPPSSLPIPAFFTRKTVLVKKNDATTDLRRILGLDLA